MRGPEDGNEDDQESVSCFLVNNTFNHSVVFIYISFKILVLILILQSPYVMWSSLFCGFGDQPHLDNLSFRYRRYPFSALHPQASAYAALATQAALVT